MGQNTAQYIHANAHDMEKDNVICKAYGIEARTRRNQ